MSDLTSTCFVFISLTFSCEMLFLCMVFGRLMVMVLFFLFFLVMFVVNGVLIVFLILLTFSSLFASTFIVRFRFSSAVFRVNLRVIMLILWVMRI